MHIPMRTYRGFTSVFKKLSRTNDPTPPRHHSRRQPQMGAGSRALPVERPRESRRELPHDHGLGTGEPEDRSTHCLVLLDRELETRYQRSECTDEDARRFSTPGTGAIPEKRHAFRTLRTQRPYPHLTRGIENLR